MKKLFLTFSTVLVLSLLFLISCNSSTPSSDGQLGFTIPDALVRSIVKKSRDAGDFSARFDSDVKFVVSLNGDGGTTRSETKTLLNAIKAGDYNENAGSITFKFTDLNVSETYSITVKAYLVQEARDFCIYEGAAENIKITAGENKVVKIVLKETDDYLNSLSTYIILYNKVNDDQGEKFNIYAFPSDFFERSSQVEPVFTAPNDDNFADFVISEDNTLYWTDGRNIFANYQDEPISHLNWGDSGLAVTENKYLRLYADNSGLLFFGGYEENNDNSFIISVCDLNQLNEDSYYNASSVVLKNALNPAWLITKVFDFATDLELVETDDPKIIVEYDGYLYIAFSYLYNNASYIAFIKASISVVSERGFEGGVDNTIRIDDSASSMKMISFYDVAYSNGDINTFAASLTNDAAITDMIVHNGDLYALLREVKINDSQVYDAPMPITFTSYARGALVKISKPEVEGHFKSANVKLLGDSSCMVPWTFDNGQGENSKRTWEFYQPSETGLFYGPQKFIGIKKRELIIADDGLFFWEENGSYKFKNINYAIVFNERTNQADEHSISSSLPIFFNEEIEEDILFTSQLDTDDNPASELTFIRTE